MKSLLSCVLCKEIIFPAFAATRDEEPVIVEADMEASQVVVTVAALTRTASSGTPRSFQQVLVQVGGGAGLDGLPARCWLVSRVPREIGVRIVDLSHKQAHPPENESCLQKCFFAHLGEARQEPSRNSHLVLRHLTTSTVWVK